MIFMPKSLSLFKVALIEPEIPSNTGNIGRSCVASQTPLDLIGPLGFELSDKYLKRAGLDYWDKLNYSYTPGWKEWFAKQDTKKLWLFSIKGTRSLYDCSFSPGETLVFGKETKGLPQELLNELPKKVVKIPFQEGVRSLNLSNAVAIALFEALRQNLYNTDSTKLSFSE